MHKQINEDEQQIRRVRPIRKSLALNQPKQSITAPRPCGQSIAQCKGCQQSSSGHNPQPMAAESTDPKLSDANLSSGESDCMPCMYQCQYLKPRHEMSAPHVIHVPAPNVFRFSYGESALHVINETQCRYLIPVTVTCHTCYRFSIHP